LPEHFEENDQNKRRTILKLEGKFESEHSNLRKKLLFQFEKKRTGTPGHFCPDEPVLRLLDFVLFKL